MRDPELEAFKARLPLADIVGRYVRLRRRGRELVGLCPFHREKTPSFTVAEDKGFYHCFGCGAHGNAIDFLMAIENLPFRDALERLSELTGVPLPARTRATPAPKIDARLYDVHVAALTWFRARLQDPEGAGARAYLERRGVRGASVETFALGYAPPSGDGLKRALLARGYGESLLLEAGLLARSERDGETFDRFRDRLMFPIHDARGRIVGFGGRALGDARAKYLNSPDTPIFHKGELLFNFHRALRAARPAGRLWVVEGYMDVIALHEAGIGEVVAPLGTALTASQLQLLWRAAREPVLCFDGDEAGRRAAWRAAVRALPLLGPGRSLQFLLLPEGEDPDTLLRSRGRSAFLELTSSALPLVEFLWRMECEHTPPSTPERRAALRRRLRELLGEIGDADIRRDYARCWRERLEEVAPARRPSRGRAMVPVDRGRIESALRELEAEAERALLRPVLRDPALLAEHEEQLAAAVFTDPRCRALRDEILHWYAGAHRVDAESLHNHLSGHDFAELIEGMIASGTDATESGSLTPEALEEWRKALVRRARRAWEPELEPGAAARASPQGGDPAAGWGGRRTPPDTTSEPSLEEPTRADGGAAGSFSARD